MKLFDQEMCLDNISKYRYILIELVLVFDSLIPIYTNVLKIKLTNNMFVWFLTNGILFKNLWYLSSFQKLYNYFLLRDWKVKTDLQIKLEHKNRSYLKLRHLVNKIVYYVLKKLQENKNFFNQQFGNIGNNTFYGIWEIINGQWRS